MKKVITFTYLKSVYKLNKVNKLNFLYKLQAGTNIVLSLKFDRKIPIIQNLVQDENFQ